MEKMQAWFQAKDAFSERKWLNALSSALGAFGDWLTEFLCDYGENVWRVLGWIGVLLFVAGPALVGALGGLRWTGDNLSTYRSLSNEWQRGWYSYFQHMLYILDAFTTASFAELKPANDYVRAVSGLIALAGIVLAGLLGFVAGNRIRTS